MDGVEDIFGDDDGFCLMGSAVSWWNQDEADQSNAYCVIIYNEELKLNELSPKNAGCYVRCIKHS